MLFGFRILSENYSNLFAWPAISSLEAHFYCGFVLFVAVVAVKIDVADTADVPNIEVFGTQRPHFWLLRRGDGTIVVNQTHSHVSRTVFHQFDDD